MKPPWVPVGIDTIKRLDDHAKLMAVKTEERRELRLTVDPCAGESVIPANEAENVPLEDGDRKGCKYEVASGGIIRNIGQRRYAVLTRDGGPPKQLNLQVSEVHKGLLSVIELIDNGHRVVFDRDLSFIQEKATCHCDNGED